MSRAVVVAAALATGVLALPAPTPAAAADRLDRAAAALARSPLFVHPDVLWLVPSEDRAAITERLRSARVPVRIAALTLTTEDESYGDARAVIFGLHQRLARPGVLVVIDDDGDIDVENFGVRRMIGRATSGLDLYRPFDAPPQLRERVTALLDAIDGAAPGPPGDPKLGTVSGPPEDEPSPLLEMLIVGAMLGALAHGIYRGGVAVVSFRRRSRGAS